MKILIGLIALVGFAGADVAIAREHVVLQTRGRTVTALARVSYKAAPPATRKATAHKATRQPVKSKVRRKGRKAPNRKAIVTRTPLLPKSDPATRQVAVRDDTPKSAPGQPGWFKAPGRAGYGVARGNSEAVVGLYTRPERPDLPGPEIYHTEPRGAAGVSLSLKLGH